MILDLTVRPDNPLYSMMRITEVKRKGKIKYFLKEKADHKASVQVTKNFLDIFNELEDDGQPLQLRNLDAAPNWVSLVVFAEASNLAGIEEIGLKIGKEIISLPIGPI